MCNNLKSRHLWLQFVKYCAYLWFYQMSSHMVVNISFREQMAFMNWLFLMSQSKRFLNLLVYYWFGSVNHLEPLLTPFNLISWENATILCLAELVGDFEWMSKKFFRKKQAWRSTLTSPLNLSISVSSSQEHVQMRLYKFGTNFPKCYIVTSYDESVLLHYWNQIIFTRTMEIIKWGQWKQSESTKEQWYAIAMTSLS